MLPTLGKMMGNDTFIPDGCVGLWFPGRGHPGQRRGTVNDLSGKNNHGTVMGVPCLYFDGAGDQAAVTTRWDALVGHRYAWLAGWINAGTIVSAGILYEECWADHATVLRFNAYIDSDSKLNLEVRAGAYNDANSTSIGSQAISKNIWHSLLICVDLVAANVKPVAYVWLDGAAHAMGLFSANVTQGTFAASVPTYQAFGIYHNGTSFPLLGYMQWLGFGGFDAPATITDAQRFHDFPQAWLAANFAAANADYWTCKSGTGNPVAGSAAAGRILILTGAAWNAYLVTSGAHLAPCLGDARNAAGTANTGDSFNAGYRYFDGGDDCVSIADSASLRFGTAPYQIHAWVNVSSGASSGAAIAGKGTGDAAGEWALKIGSGPHAGKLRFHFEGTVINSQFLIRDDLLHLLSVLRNGDTTKLYIDGVEKATSSTASNLNEATKAVELMATNDDSPCAGKLYKVFLGTANKTIAQAIADMIALRNQGPYR